MLPSSFHTRIDAQGVRLDERCERHLQSGLDRLETFTRSLGDRRCHVHFAKDHRRGVGVRMSLVVPGQTVVAEAFGAWPLAAIDTVLRKIKRQLRERKGWQQALERNGAARPRPAPVPLEASPRVAVAASLAELRAALRRELRATAGHRRHPALEVDDLVDETVMEILEHLDEKPGSLGISEWMHLIGHDVLDRAIHEDALATFDATGDEAASDDADEGPLGEPRWRFELLVDRGPMGRVQVIGSEAHDPAEEAETADLGARAERLLADLPAAWSEALRWNSVDGVPSEEIARRQGRTVVEVDRDLDRAAAALRARLVGAAAFGE